MTGAKFFDTSSKQASALTSVRRLDALTSGSLRFTPASVSVVKPRSRLVSINLALLMIRCSPRSSLSLTSWLRLPSSRLIPFDTEVAVDKVYTWKKGQTKKTERVLTGGTCFDAPTKYVNERDFDGHIVLTDLCAPKPVASKCQRMWMTTSAHAARPTSQTNERVIAIDA